MNDPMSGCKSCAEPGVITVNNELLCGLCFCRVARNEASQLRRGQGATLQDVAKAATLIADLARYLRESAATMAGQ